MEKGDTFARILPFSCTMVEHLGCLGYGGLQAASVFAKQDGLTVPKTAITNNPEAAEKLFEEAENGRAIFKTLSRLYIEPDIIAYTAEIKREFPSAFQTSVTRRPAIYQELVERKSNLRITVVGRKAFPVRIASQIVEDQKDRLDWRRCQGRNELYSVAE